MKKTISAISAAGIWITFSEFARNELLFKTFWTAHFNSIGLNFQTLPLNGILWMIWSFALAYLVFRLLPFFSFTETVLTAWLPAFIMMWITIYNLQVLPLKLLIPAVPLSLLEVFIAGVIIKRIFK